VEKQILSNDICHTKTDESKLIWTGSKVEFVEFGYGLKGTKCINHGKISLKKLFHGLGKTFNFEVKDYARIFMDIKRRGKDDCTFLLDLMRTSVLQQIEESIQRPSRK
jgi:hypothetical protein